MRKHILQFLAACTVIIALIVSVFWYVGNHYSNYSADRNLIVDRTDCIDIVEQFKQKNISKNSFITTVYIKLFEFFGKSVIFGEYKLPTNVSIVDALKIITSGKVVVHKICIPEGFSVAQTIDKLDNNQCLLGKVTEIPEEGALFPDTYYFKYPTTKQDIIRTATRAMNKIRNEIAVTLHHNSTLQSVDDVIILASIVEKERTNLDAKLIAGVYLNRLRVGMRLQADPTVIYAMTHGRSLGRPLKLSDLRKKIPGNTYRYKGLPETPICNPGREAIDAVLYPSNHDFLFFVHDSNRHIYLAKNFNEHLRNIKLIKSRSINKKKQCDINQIN